MTGSPWLNGAILVVSLTNTILLFWLGLTVVLNTERRSLGLYLAGGSLLLGGSFFLSHTAIISLGFALRLEEINIWWRAGWIPVTCLPFLWYSIMLWYGGYWEPDSALRLRHRPWFLVSLSLAGLFVILLGFAHSLPSAAQLLAQDLTAAPSMFGIPVLVLFYPWYTVLCTGLTLDVLRWPSPTRRTMAEQARQRALPWLGAASLGLFIVSLLVGGTVFWVVITVQQPPVANQMIGTISLLDLIISSLIAFVILLVGQAIVSYEVFTGKSLPRRGLQRYWRRVVVLAFIYSLVASIAALNELLSIYSLLLVTLMLTGFYALLAWRSFEERERLMDSLRPFLTSHDLYQELLFAQSQPETSPADRSSTTNQAAFQALCTDVLETSLAYLVPMGSLAPLVGPALVYPPQPSAPVFSVDLSPQEQGEFSGWQAVDPQHYAGARWAVPLYSRTGSLSGALFLGDKREGGLYTQEEVDVARLASESLLDRQASAELARRLMSLQRQRLVESQVMDHQARRALHDEILPQLHEIILHLSSKPGEGDLDQSLLDLSAIHAQIASLLRQLPSSANPEVTRLGLPGALRILVEEEYRSHFDHVSWQVEAEALQRLQDLPALPAEVVYFAVREAVRNAARYGRGDHLDRALHLTLRAESGPMGLSIMVQDDGIGLAHLPENPANGGAGQGLALHSTLLAVLGGTLSVENLSIEPTPEPGVSGPGTQVTVRLPPEVFS